jgi:hypothetical protein
MRSCPRLSFQILNFQTRLVIRFMYSLSWTEPPSLLVTYHVKAVLWNPDNYLAGDI